MALLGTEDRQESVPVRDWMTMRSSDKEEQGEQPTRFTPARTPKTSFLRDIQPILERSCGACHGTRAKKNKGSFSILTPSSIQSGGQSKETLVTMGNGQKSVLIQMITDRIEDLEMPPLSKRQKFPALSTQEVWILTTWIDEGLPE